MTTNCVACCLLKVLKVPTYKHAKVALAQYITAELKIMALLKILSQNNAVIKSQRILQI